MNGKELRVAEYNLTFGKSARLINVFGIFRYKSNNNLYIIYTDVNTSYNVVRYGSSHIKGNKALSMKINNDNDVEVIKEYIFKVTNNENLDDFEIINLDNIEEVEIIGSNMLEIKKEVLLSLIDLTIPKKEVKEEVIKKAVTKKKGNSLKILLVFLVIVIAGIGVYYYFNIMNRSQVISKQITCNRSYNHKELNNVDVVEERVFSFNNNDTLESVDISSVYNFNNEDNYLDFINKGLYYKYMPDAMDTEGGWSKDDTLYTFTTILKERVDTSYDEPTLYEDVLSYYKNEGYSCSEEIIE